jgi:hypothetical protein
MLVLPRSHGERKVAHVNIITQHHWSSHHDHRGVKHRGRACGF